MPQSLLCQVNPWVLQLFASFMAACLLVGLLARASHRFIQAFPDDTPEKPELLQASGSLWFLLWPVVAIGVFYALLVWALAPLLAFVGLVLALLTPLLVLMLRHRDAYLDAPFAAVEVMAARLTRRPPDPQRWLTQHRRQVERRRRLAVLPHIMLALMIALVLVGAAGYISIDRVLAARMRWMTVGENVQQQLGLPAGTVFARTPPCVDKPTLVIVPQSKIPREQAKSLQEQAQTILRQLDPRQEWQVGVVTDKIAPPKPPATDTAPKREK